MRWRFRTFLLVVVVACLAVPPRAIADTVANCSGTSTGRTPLLDLGSGTYQGFQGGLYPGGSNVRPSAHDSAGLAIAQSIQPLDTLGHVDPARGRIVFISIGMSNATQEFQTFVPKANADPLKNPRVLVVDCAVGGQAANVIRNPNAAYWDSVAARLRRAGSSPAQVQTLWIKQANAGPTGGFPAATESLRGNLATIARVLKQKLPNVKIAYLTSRIYAGYATTSLNPEPYAYESGFAVKWLIESQIAGVDSLNFDPARGPVVAPWLSWGPYLWADGLVPRSDGLTWPCSYFADDGTHPAAGARNLVADSLLAFLKHDETSRPWFVGSATGVAAEGATISSRPSDLHVFPMPVSRTLQVRRDAGLSAGWVELVNVFGRRVRTIRLDAGTAPRGALSVDVGDLPSGVYVAIYRARDRGEVSARKFVVVR